MSKPSCLLCGKCCYYIKEDKLKKCQHLVWLRSGRTLCRIYNHKDRIGKVLDKDIKVICINRKDSKFNFPNCPYNSGKDIHPGWRE